MKLYDAAATRRIDAAAGTDWGLAGGQLMQRAGEAAFDDLIQTWPMARRLLVLAGAGNNAGDGYVVARCARAAGLDVCIAQLLPSPTAGAAADHHAALVAAGVTFIEADAVAGWLADAAEDTEAQGASIVVDAVFGSGLTRPVGAPIAEVFAACANADLPVLALDVPSGVSTDTGAVLGAALPADRTVTFIVPKVGLFTGEALIYAGNLQLADLGVPPRAALDVTPSAESFSYADFAPLLRPRRRTAHKGDFGHVLVVGGYEGMPGATLLAGMAAARGGAGLVSLATWPAHAASLVAACPSLMARPVATPGDLTELLTRASVVVVGPGLGRAPWSAALLEAVLATDKPMVLDADALNWLAESGALPEVASAPRVLTPHPGEAARLLGTDTAGVASDRLGAAREIARRYNAVCVLKGAGTVVASVRGLPGICTDGNPGLATGGSGDVLAGLLGAMLAQPDLAGPAQAAFAPDGESAALPIAGAEAAVRLGVALHAHAGDVAARLGQRGMLAADLLPELRALINPDVAHSPA